MYLPPNLIKNRVPTLTQCELLKKNGISQRSVYCWHGDGSDDYAHQVSTTDEVYSEMQGWLYETRVAAFDVYELGEMLPKWVVSKKAYNNPSGRFFCTVVQEAKDLPNSVAKLLPSFYADTEARARAEMLLFLLRKRILKVHDINLLIESMYPVTAQ
jgi:hypothetical protein